MMKEAEVSSIYTIGQFSRIGMVSTSALRFYDEIGLLKPHSVDSWNGYRYYSEEQIGDILFISEMREYGFSLDEIKGFMENKADIRGAMEKKNDQLFWDEQKIIYIRRKLRAKINCMEGDEMAKSEGMQVKVEKREAVRAAGIAMDIPAWPPEDMAIFEAFWAKYWDEDVSSKIPDRKYPFVRYGILTFAEGKIQYLIADEVHTYDNLPPEFVRFDIPEGEFAVCTFSAQSFPQLVNESLFKANDYLLSSWLPESGYAHAGTFALEVYDERSRRQQYPEMDICQPVTK